MTPPNDHKDKNIQHASGMSTPVTATINASPTPCEKGLPCVLVVEDNRLNSELVKVFLKGICGMDFARTGEEAVEMAGSKRYDAIIMDINLGPGMNGIQATKIIRTFPGFAEIPIIAVTGYAMESEKEMILASGCNHFLSKPIEKNSFTTLVKSLLQKD